MDKQLHNVGMKLFLHCNRWSLRMDNWFYLALYNGCNSVSLLGLKLIHVSKRPLVKHINFAVNWVIIGWWLRVAFYLYHGYFIIDWTTGNNILWWNPNTKGLFQEIAFENIACAVKNFAKSLTIRLFVWWLCILTVAMFCSLIRYITIYRYSDLNDPRNVNVDKWYILCLWTIHFGKYKGWYFRLYNFSKTSNNV